MTTDNHLIDNGCWLALLTLRWPLGLSVLTSFRNLSARTALALRAGRIVGRVSRRAGIGAGVTIGGRVALAVAPGALAELAGGREAVVVSGTNGKTTTTRLLAAALAAWGGAVVSNETGANLASGLASALSSGDPSARPVLEVAG